MRQPTKLEKFGEAAMATTILLAFFFFMFCLWQISEGISK